MHKFVNEVESKRLIGANLVDSNAAVPEDQDMMSTEKERELAKLMQRIAQLPKSYQLNLAGERQYLQHLRGSSEAAVPEDEAACAAVDTEQLRARLSFRSENYIEDVSGEGVSRE